MTKNWQKRIRQLQQKKYRKQEGLFFVEGAKSVEELLQSEVEAVALFCTEEYAGRFFSLASSLIETHVSKEAELVSAGTFRSNNSALAVAKMPKQRPIEVGKAEFALALDDIRDPGNMGAILRVADWYGIHKIIASETCADRYNPKTLAASMGSFLRVQVQYCDLAHYFRQWPDLPVFGTYMDGPSAHGFDFGERGAILIGNESQGIGEGLAPLVSKRVGVPRFGKAESLNAAVATAVLCDNLRRNAPAL